MPKPKSNEENRGFRRVVLIGLVSLFTDVATEMVFALLPLFVVEQLGATTALLGLMEGAAESLNDMLRVFSGLITDRVGRRKPLMVVGYTVSAITKPLFGIANDFATAFSLRLTDRGGKGIRTSARDVLLTDSISEKQRGKAFGFHRSMDQVGAVVGPVLAYLLLPFLGIRGIFLVSIIPGAVSVLIVVFLVHDVRIRSKSRTGNFLHNARSVINVRLASYLAVIGVFAAGAYNFAFVLLKAHYLGVADSTVPLVYAILNLATVLVAIPFGMLADRVGNHKVLLIAYAVFFATNLGNLTITSGPVYAFILAFGYGLFLGTSDTVQRALIPALVPLEFKGTGFALYYLVLGVGALAANVVFGILWNSVSIESAYTYSLTMSAVGIVGLGMLLLEKH